MFGPVFERETRDVTRRGRYYALRSLFAGILFLTVLISIARFSDDLRDGATPVRLMPRIAANIFESATLAQYGLVLLATPLLVCGLIHSERAGGTFELLRATELTDRDIIVGKLASRLVVMALIVASGMPVLCLTMLFGGIDPIRLLFMEAAALIAAYFAASIAMVCETRTASHASSILSTYVALAVSCSICVCIPISPTLALWLIASPWLEVGPGPPYVFALTLAALITPMLASTSFVRKAILQLRRSSPFRDRSTREERETAQEKTCIVGGIAIIGGLFFISLNELRVGYLWLFIFAPLAFIASRSSLTDRRSGVREVLLTTPLEGRELLGLVAGANLKTATRLLSFPALILGVRSLLAPGSGIIDQITGCLFAAVLYLMTTIVSIVAAKPTNALLPAGMLALSVFALPRMLSDLSSWGGIVSINVPLIFSFALSQTGVVLGLGLFGLVVLAISWCAQSKEPTAANVSAWLVALHLAIIFPSIIAFALSWSSGTVPIKSLARLDPIFWASSEWMRGRRAVENWTILPVYLLALVANLGVMWLWAERNFDRLAGRIPSRPPTQKAAKVG